MDACSVLTFNKVDPIQLMQPMGPGKPGNSVAPGSWFIPPMDNTVLDCQPGDRYAADGSIAYCCKTGEVPDYVIQGR